MLRTVADMKATAREAADVRWWTQQYPWYAVGAAAVVGFVAATQLLTPAHQPAQPAPPAQAAARPTLVSSLFDMVRSALMTTIAEALRPGDRQAERAQARADSAP